jgi:GNAT superfamily N-acetyltransferase
MPLLAEPERPFPPGGEELSAEEYFAVRKIDRARDAWTDDPDEVRQSLVADERQARAGQARRFGARAEDGTPVSWCTLLHDGAATWEIDDVGTLEEHRNKGHSRATLGAAVAAVRADAETIYLTADEDDWVIGFYERLGFRRAGRWNDFKKRLGTPAA